MSRETIPWRPTAGSSSGPYENITAEMYMDYLRRYGTYNKSTKGYDSTEALDRWFQWYNDYLGKIKPYEGTEYYQQLLNNPYASFQQWKGDPWQTIGNAMTGSGENSFYNDRENNAQEELSRILGMMEENQRNSSVSQVMRDRAAGINDTLSGQIAGDTPAASAAPDETPPDPGPGAGDFGQFMQDIVGLTSGFVTGCVNLAKSFNELGLQNIAKKAGKVDLAEKMRGFMLENEAGKMPGPTKIGDKYDFSNALDGLVAPPKLGLSGEPLDPSQVRSTAPVFKDRKLQQMYNRMRGTVAYDSEGKPTVALQRAYKKMYADTSEDVLRGAQAASHPGFDPDDIPSFSASLAVEETSVVNAIRKADLDLRGISKRHQSAQADSAEARAAYDQEYYSPELGEAARQDAMGEFDLKKSIRAVEKSKAEFNKAIQQARNNLMEKCKGKTYAMILLPGLLSAVDSVGDRVLDHFDTFIDGLMPAGLAKKAFGQLNKALGSVPVPKSGAPLATP